MIAALYIRDLLVEVLISHQRLDNGHCSCGRLGWGQSFAAHVADAYEKRVAAPPTVGA